MKKHTYTIKDWAGNECFHGRTFQSEEDAWECVYRDAENESEETGADVDEIINEYYVVTSD